jgi:hypothetical protein
MKFYYHYGLFEDEEHIIQFGLPDNQGTNPEDIAVITTDMQTFLAGGMLETAQLSFAEKRKRRSPQESVAYAHSRLGTTGYNILHNNCEHFVNECVFGQHQSTFVDEVRSEVRRKL